MSNPGLEKCIRLVAFVLLLSFASNAQAQSRQQTHFTSYRDFATFDVPESFVHAYEAGVFERHIVEFLPKGETLNEWSKLLSFKGVIPARVAPGANTYAKRFIESYDEVCAEKTVRTFAMNGDEAVFGIFCRSKAGNPLPGGPGIGEEITLFRVVRTSQALYQIHFSWHANEEGIGREDVQSDFYKEAAPMVDTVQVCALASKPPCRGLDYDSLSTGLTEPSSSHPCDSLPKDECKPVAMFDAMAHESAEVTKKKIPFMPIKFDETELDNRNVVNQLISGISRQLSDGAPGISLAFRHSSPAHRISHSERLVVATFLNLLRSFLISRKLVDPNSVRVTLVNFR